MMLALVLLLQAASGDVVVTGKRLVEAHTACVHGGCTPLRDAQASIAMAETQFRAGDYVRAKKTLAAAIDRNREHAADAPKPVAALYEAFATVSLQEGDQDDFRTGLAGQVRTLRRYVPANDPARVAAEVALGDMWIQLHRFDQAEITFRGIASAAERQGEPVTAMLASMRLVWLTAARGDRVGAVQMLSGLEKAPSASNPGFRTALDVLRLRISARNGSDAEVDALVRRVGRGDARIPTLIYAPPYGGDDSVAQARSEARRFGERDPARIESTDFETLGWIDAGFYIRPDGTTSDVELLRSSKTRPDWTPIALDQIARRRYTAVPVASGDAGLGLYRVERITKATSYQAPIGSMIRRRVASDGYRTLDLTAGS